LKRGLAEVDYFWSSNEPQATRTIEHEHAVTAYVPEVSAGIRRAVRRALHLPAVPNVQREGVRQAELYAEQPSARNDSAKLMKGNSMLVLSRKRNESIVIGDVVVTVCEIRNGAVRIGIEAPEDAKVMRSELLERRNES